jgi:hypothetical protein
MSAGFVNFGTNDMKRLLAVSGDLRFWALATGFVLAL